ncbi:UNVERIFIED_CONTAM: DUF3298 domain-containing protein [Pseudomonas sp. CM11]|nr:DUF3298 and DUF4163 domain-containing protein [uncultured Pseudomonas sp.]
MRLFPSKRQWGGWSLPSKYTAIGLYVTLLPMIVAGVSYVAVQAEKFLSSQIEIVEVIKKEDDFKDVFSNYNPGRSIEISYPYVDAALSSDYIDKINREVEGNILGAIQNNLLQYQVRYEVGVISKNLISFKVYQYYYYEGAINGNESEFSLNFDPVTERFFDFFDVFDARRDALNEIKKKIAREVNSVCEAGVFEDKFQKSSYVPRFFIREDDIEFVFSEYEVAPGVCGSFVVKLPYKSLVNYLKVDGPLGRLAPASGNWEAGEHFVNGIMEVLEKNKSE